ncbi:hypothetical protein [Nocardioides alkalitolerans]|uniref:hypothetical protein n=1 Tax=Nocardioides alkalitolerans TaxID=281714 RepID=UPI000416D5C2|nr:hypothetical protein [Nocardioides alkalitolerans]
MGETRDSKKAVGATWWALQAFVGLMLAAVSSSNVSSDSGRLPLWVDWTLLVLGVVLAINALVFVVITWRAGKRGWIVEQ